MANLPKKLYLVLSVYSAHSGFKIQGTVRQSNCSILEISPSGLHLNLKGRHNRLSCPNHSQKNYRHIVFSTKYRQRLIHESVQNELYNYIGGTCREFECYPVQIGGYIDHMHILYILSQKITLMQLLKEVKTSSSKWMKTKGDSLRNFYWQRGYGAFSVNPAQINVVKLIYKIKKLTTKRKPFRMNTGTFSINIIEYERLCLGFALKGRNQYHRTMFYGSENQYYQPCRGEIIWMDR